MKLRWTHGIINVVTTLLLPFGVGSAFAQDQTKKEGAAQPFMEEAAQGGLAEVTLGQMAMDKGKHEAVKEFGRRMVNDHGKANEELTTLAKSENVTLPTTMSSEVQELQQRLQKLSGAEFDKAYMQEMLKDHKKDIEAFDQQATQGTDAEVKKWAAQTLPTLREHYQMAQTAAEKIGVKTSDAHSSHESMSATKDDTKKSHASH